MNSTQLLMPPPQRLAHKQLSSSETRASSRVLRRELLRVARGQAICGLAMLLAVIFVWQVASDSVSAYQDGADEAATEDLPGEELPLIEKEPFDLLILINPGEANAELEIETNSFPDRQVPQNPPGADKLRFRLIDDSINLYEVPWRNVVEVRLYEQMLLEEARQLIAREEVDEAYRYLRRLDKDYPELAGLPDAYKKFLYVDADLREKAGQWNGALAVWEELESLDADYRPGSGGAPVAARISDVLDEIIGSYVQAKDYGMARDIMLRVEVRHEDRQAAVIERWQAAIRADAEGHRDDALRFYEAGEGRKAHEAIRRMLNVLPEIEGGQELATRIMQRYPLVLVGVDQPFRDSDPQSIHDWAARRVGRMSYRSLVEFEGQGQDGGQYRFPLGRIEYGDDGKSFAFQFTNADESGEGMLNRVDAYRVSKRILDRADERSLSYSPAWQRILKSVEIQAADRVFVQLRQAHVLPEAWLQVAFQERQAEDQMLPPNGPFMSRPSDEPGTTFEFNAAYAAGEEGGTIHPQIVELAFSRAEDAVNALRRGDIDIIDRVFPGDLRQLRGLPGVAVDVYDLPTVHMLVPNKRTEHMRDRSFRLALMMGIDRESILRNALLGGLEEPGFEVVSGPFPIGRNDSDPINYGYNFRSEPLNYDWRLAGTMVLLAENALKAMLERLEQELPPRPTLVLAHPSNPIAKVACGEIKRQWQLIGIECELRPLPPGHVWPNDEDWDLVYTQVSIAEPLVDARTLLAEDGIVGSDNSSVDLALRQLDVANSWPEARRRLNELHTFVSNDAVVIPLYQTMDYYAYRTSVRGVGRQLISLYDNVADWRVVTGAVSGEPASRLSTNNAR